MRSIHAKGDPRRGRFSIALSAALVLAAIALVGLPLGCKRDLTPPLPAAHGDDAAPIRGGTLHLAAFTEMRSLDPAGPFDTLALQAAHLIFSGLIDYDEQGRLVADLADHWEVTEGGRIYRFTLRQGVRMHDGAELTADDVKRSVERALHPTTPNPIASMFDNIAGYASYAAGKAEHLEGIVVDGRYAVSFHLREPDAAFLPMLAMHSLRPVCKSGGDRYVDTWLPCGAGPFRLEPGAWQRGIGLRLVRHDGYFRPGQPYLDAVEWTFNMQLVPQRFRFEDGQLDILRDLTQSDATRFATDPHWRALAQLGADTEIWGESMNVRVPPFDNVEVRRALAAAVDRRHYAMLKPTNMSATTQLLPRGVPGYDPTVEGQRFDLDAALEHMRKAGYPYDPATGQGGWPKPIRYTVTEQTLASATAQLLQRDLAKIGLRLELHLVSWAAYLAITSREGASALSPYGASMDFADPSNFFEGLFATSAINAESSANPSFYSNARYDDLVARARHEMDASVRTALYHEANTLLCDEAPWAFTYSVHNFFVHQAYVRGFKPHPIFGIEVSRVWLDRAAGAFDRVLRGGLLL
jgi:ABC-type transport system substrate-binding protein